MQAERHVRLFCDGRSQVVRIPREFELDAGEVIIRKEGDRLILEPVKNSSLLETLAQLKPLDEAFPDIEENTLPLDDVEL